MRDLIITFALPFLLYFSFKKPFIALGIWLWSSAFNIHDYVYGFAQSIPFTKIFAISTILSFIFSNERKNFSFNTLTIIIVLFFLVTALSNMSEIGNRELSWDRWELFFKVIAFYFFATAILNKKLHIDYMIWMLVISIGALASIEGLKFIITAGSHRFNSVKGISGDNNFFGVMILTVLPLATYLISQTNTSSIRYGLMFVCFLMCCGIFASYSRGAFAGLFIFAFSFWLNSNKKAGTLILIILLLLCSSYLLPEQWFERMNSIGEANEDSSFMGRVVAWKISILIAMDNLFGGGFNALENINVWRSYSLDFDKLDFIKTPYPDFDHFLASHSIYFQVLGNHGFVGLFLYLTILITAFFKILVLQNKKMEPWMSDLVKMLKISLIVFCVSGALVNVAYMDFIYAIFAMISVLSTKAISNKGA